MDKLSEREAIGGNYPPEPIDYLQSRECIAGLLVEAGNWLDGKAIADQAQADEVARLMAMFREAIEEANNRRKAEVDPLNKAKDAIQERWNTLIGDTKTVKGSAVLALSSCKALLLPWEVAQENARREAAEAARREAAEADKAARLQHMLADKTDLAARQDAEEATAEAKRAAGEAKAADRAKSATKAGGRALGVRKTYSAELGDRRIFLNWLAANHPERLEALLRVAADDLVKAGVREIPGVQVIEGNTLA